MSDGNSYICMDHHLKSKLLLQQKKTYYLRQETLSQQLLGPPTQLDVEEGVVGLADLSVPEPAQAELHHRAVVQDLRGGVGVGDRVLEKRSLKLMCF